MLNNFRPQKGLSPARSLVKPVQFMPVYARTGYYTIILSTFVFFTCCGIALLHQPSSAAGNAFFYRLSFYNMCTCLMRREKYGAAAGQADRTQHTVYN